MLEILMLLLGGAGGFILHIITMKVSFKQRLIDQKVKVYYSIITRWVEMRNFVYANHSGDPGPSLPRQVMHNFDQMYGGAQVAIGEAILVCEDQELTDDINQLNENFYRTEWSNLPIDEANEKMEALKVRAFTIISRMREDIKLSTRFERSDLKHMLSGLFTK